MDVLGCMIVRSAVRDTAINLLESVSIITQLIRLQYEQYIYMILDFLTLEYNKRRDNSRDLKIQAHTDTFNIKPIL